MSFIQISKYVKCRICNDIFNHTSLYQYHHGKLLLHLTLPFKERPKSNQPGEYLRCYRLRNNLATRQLAEQVGIVPATLLKYEQRLTPIPYDIAMKLSERPDSQRATISASVGD